MKFGYSTSEDACSWVFITYFFKENKPDVLKDILGLESEIKDILFWGVSYNDLINSKISEISDGILESNNIIKNLKQSADDIGEVPKLKTEPDIIVVTDEELVFIEVKVKSGMPKDDWSNFKKYNIKEYYINFERLKGKYNDNKNPFYELVRNWTLLNALGEKLNKKVSLINLVREEETKEIKIFKDAIKQKPKKRNFKIKTWKEIFKELEEEHKINVYDGSFKNLEDNKCF